MSTMDAASVDDAAFAPSRRRWQLPRGWPLLSFYLTVVLVFLICGAFADLVVPHDPTQQVLTNPRQVPVWQDGGSWDHVLGTDRLGRDVFSRLIKGSQISLIAIATVIPGSLLLGTGLGLLAGWR